MENDDDDDDDGIHDEKQDEKATLDHVCRGNSRLAAAGLGAFDCTVRAVLVALNAQRKRQRVRGFCLLLCVALRWQGGSFVFIYIYLVLQYIIIVYAIFIYMLQMKEGTKNKTGLNRKAMQKTKTKNNARSVVAHRHGHHRCRRRCRSVRPIPITRSSNVTAT